MSNPPDDDKEVHESSLDYFSQSIDDEIGSYVTPAEDMPADDAPEE